MYRDHHLRNINDFFIFHLKKCFCAIVLTMLFSLLNSVCDFKATIEKQHINKANLPYKSSNDSAKMAVYLSSSKESRLGSLPKNELCM